MTPALSQHVRVLKDAVRPEEVVFEPSIGGRVYERLGHYEEAVSG